MIQRNNGPTGDEPGATVHALFEHHAELAPDRTAVVADDGQLSYRELNARANRLAWRLREAGVGPDTLVGICVERSAAMIVGLLGILKAGGAYVPLDAGYPAERLEFMLRDTAAPVLVTQRRLADRLPAGRATVVLLDEDPAHHPSGNLPAVGRPELANVIYTSGSTGTPKGVLVPHRSVVHLVTDQDYVSIAPDDRVAALATLSFDASTFEIWGPLLNGATCVVYSFGGTDLTTLCRRVHRDAVSVLHLTSPVFRLLEPAHLADLSGVHTLLFGGDSIRAEVADLARQAFAGRLIHLYGPTETTGFATYQDVRTMAPDATMIPIGTPLDRVRVRVLGPDGADVPDGESGELHIGGAGMTRGYLGRAELTAERFVPDPDDHAGSPLYRTGDLVRRGPDGALRFLGRIDRQIKVRGYRIEPGEIEAALTRHPGVHDAVVVARDDGAGDKRLDAYVVPSSGPASGPASGSASGPVGTADGAGRDRELVADLRRRLSTELPRYQRPASITVIPAIPLTTNLKVDAAKLPAPAEERDAAQGSPTAPRDELESALAALWREMLGLTEVGIDDDFFTLGGDSVSAVQLATAATRLSGVPVTVRDVIGSPTIRGLSALADGSAAVRADGAAGAPAGSPRPTPAGGPA
ncbi:amino acid adenylation domain-containing protein [Kitasatospora sp. NPDC057518]|uniref:non-ribosomal peptide synthetase n=1 Tax=Kitasatospora sp. NPDC057518 TaxID=3346155 RepID=UPI00368C07AC